jgi:hypothetical protein
MDKIYQDANEKNVAAVIIYKKSAQTKAYADEDCTVQLTTAELKNAFIKGAVIKLEDGAFVKPIKYDESSSIGSVYYIKPNGTTATSADIASLVAAANP